MRSRNDIDLILPTLEVLDRQDHPLELIVFDNASTDGTLEAVRRHAKRVHHIPEGGYVPGQVLNRAMEVSRGEIVVFLNSDCTPVHRSWLSRLVAGFEHERVAAVFGRQVARPGHHLLHVKDTEDAFGGGDRQRRWRHFFSMATSAIRRSVWKEVSFDESLQYSEDVDWTWRVRRRGFEVRYVCDSVVLHSHDYSLRQFYRRHRGEGQAEARIFQWGQWQRSWIRYSLLPYVRQVVSDWRFCLERGAIGEALYSPALRMAQMLGRRAGFLKGLRQCKGNGE
jgi:rhamnosyltransferase